MIWEEDLAHLNAIFIILPPSNSGTGNHSKFVFLLVRCISSFHLSLVIFLYCSSVILVLIPIMYVLPYSFYIRFYFLNSQWRLLRNSHPFMGSEGSLSRSQDAIFELFTSMKFRVVFSIMTPCSDMVRYPEDGGSKVLQNVGILPHLYPASQPRLECSQEFATCPYTELDECSPHSHTLLLSNQF